MIPSVLVKWQGVVIMGGRVQTKPRHHVQIITIPRDSAVVRVREWVNKYFPGCGRLGCIGMGIFQEKFLSKFATVRLQIG